MVEENKQEAPEVIQVLTGVRQTSDGQGGLDLIFQTATLRLPPGTVTERGKTRSVRIPGATFG